MTVTPASPSGSAPVPPPPISPPGAPPITAAEAAPAVHAHAQHGAALRRSIGAAIASITLTGYAVSMSFPYFAVSLERMGASNFAIGLNAAAPALAMLIGAPLLPPLLRRVGLPALCIAASLIIALSLAPLPWIDGIWAWTAMRFLFGFGSVAAFYASELWIAAAAPPARKGALIGFYGACLSLGFIAGAASLQWLPIGTPWPALAAAGLACLSTLPILHARRDAPGGMGGAAGSVAESLRLFAANPTVLTAVCVFGAVESGGFALLPVWGLGVGLPETAALALSVWIAIGNLALQPPLGWLSDRVPRRGLILAAGLCVALGAPALALLADGGLALILAVTLIGGMAVALYSVSLAEIGMRYAGHDLSRMSAAFMFAYGLGALGAPPVMGALADAFPPHGMLWALGAAGAMAACVAALRARRSG